MRWTVSSHTSPERYVLWFHDATSTSSWHQTAAVLAQLWEPRANDGQRVRATAGLDKIVDEIERLRHTSKAVPDHLFSDDGTVETLEDTPSGENAIFQ
jgi:hypothetical protein